MRRGVRKYIILVLIILLFSSFPVVSFSETVQTEISADTLEHQAEEGIYILKGNIRIRKGDVVLQAEEAEFNEKTSQAVLKGKVTYEDKDAVIQSESAEINIDKKTGTLHDAYIFFKKDNYHIEAEKIEKTGENSYIVTQASFTTCDAPVPAWCFRTKKADILVEDRIIADNVVFKIKNVPVFYTPYLWAPIDTERKTGFLLPEFGHDSDLGTFYRQPFFLVLGENRDATLMLDYYDDRGVGQGLEYRYIERGGIAGEWWGYHIRDRELRKDFYELKGRHSQFKNKGVSHFLNLNLINDRGFYETYSSEVETRIQRFLTSSGSVSYQYRPLRLYLSGQYWYDLEFENDNTIQQLPSAGVTLNPVGIGPLILSVDTEVANFYSEDFVRARRYSISPEIFASFGDAVHLNQRLRLTGAIYDMENTGDYPSNTDRGILDYTAGLSTSIFRKYSRFTHSIEPEIRYQYITDTDYDAPLFDSQEIITERSDIVLSLENKLIDKKGLLFSFKLSQPYNLFLTYHPLKPLEANLYVKTPFFVKFQTFYDHYIKGVIAANGEAGLNLKGFNVSAGKRYNRENDISYYTGKIGFNVSRNISVQNSVWYEAREQSVRYMTSSLSYSAQCWGVTLTFNKKPGDYGIMAVFELKGVGELPLGMM